MKKFVIIGILIVVTLVILVGAGVVWFMVGNQSVAPSGPINAPALEVGAAGGTTFEIVPEESEVRFILDELLRGEPVTVVGATDQVAGLIAIDPANPLNSTAGTVRINARTFKTDSDRRDGAINKRILNTEQYEFIEFTPTALNGLPDAVSVGEPVSFQIVGDLTIRDITNPVIFEVTATPVSETRIEANASTTVQRGVYNLNIPNVPFVADVSEEVKLEIDFIAAAQ